MNIEYVSEKKFAWFNGLKYTRDEKTGYYLNATSRKRLHRAVWEFHNGEVKSGFHIHHVDHDKSNNDIQNLSAISSKSHLQHHGREKMKDRLLFEKFHSAGIASAAEWHSSEEGAEWHKQHYESMKHKLHVKTDRECSNCGKTHQAGVQKQGSNSFCSNSCKSAWRRKAGFDDIEVVCQACGVIFTANKYAKRKTCGRVCSGKLRKSKGDKEARG